MKLARVGIIAAAILAVSTFRAGGLGAAGITSGGSPKAWGSARVAVILSLLIGGELLGLVGALLAVPTAAIVQVLFEELYLAEKTPAVAKDSVATKEPV